MRISAKDQYQTTRIGTNTMDVQNQTTSDGDQYQMALVGATTRDQNQMMRGEDQY